MNDTNYLKKELYKLIKSDESIFDFIQESSLDGLWNWDLEQPEEEYINGSTVWIRCRRFTIRDRHDKPPGRLGAHQRITDLKNSELLPNKFLK